MNKLKTYFSKQLFIVFGFGIASGLPLALVFGTLSLWLDDYNIAYRTIGAFGLLRLPYSFKWIWAPVVENFKLPLLWRLGKRRSWAMFAELGVFFSILVISLFKPDENLKIMAVAAFFISFFSATLDIVLDAFRVELLEGDEQAEVNGATMYVLGWRIGSIFSGAIAIGLAEYMSFNAVYLLMGGMGIIGILAVFFAKEPLCVEKTGAFEKQNLWKNVLIEPIRLFMQKPYFLVALGLVFCYRLSDAYFASMAYPFYASIGFNKTEIAYASKLYGMVATIIGGILGGVVLNKTGLFRGLLIFSLVQGVTTALYIPLYYAGHNLWCLLLTISFENLSSGMATTAIIAFMSLLCNKGYTATQYALLSSLPGVARDVFGATSGMVLDMTSWPIFFMISALLTLPGTFLSWFLYKKRPNYVLNS